MKTKLILISTGHLLFALCFSAFAQGTAFTYQGRLTDNGGPANGNYDFRFRLATDPLANNYAGGSFLANGVATTNGLFTVTLDFGGGIFAGSNYWLEVDVRTNGGGSYATLAPLQAVTPAPYAVFAGGISAAGLSGTYANPVSLSNAGNNFSGSFTGNGANVTNVNAITLGGLSATNFWKTSGNTGTGAGANFLGTTDNQPLELSVNRQRGFRLEPTTNSPNLIGGFSGNCVTNGATGAFIGGGGAATVFGASGLNCVSDHFGVIGGGADNRAGNTNADPTDAYFATVAGGVHNVAEGIATFIGGGAQNRTANNNSTITGGYQNTNSGYISSIGGGRLNFIGDPADQSTIGGGSGNRIIGSELSTVASTIGGGLVNIIQTNVSYSTIAGGAINEIQEGSYEAAIAGGYLNVILTNSPYCAIGGGYGNRAGSVSSVVPGGYQSEARGAYSFSAGRQAKANHDGAFVWADSQAADFNSTATNQFNVRANGGVRFVTSGAGLTVDGTNVALRAGGNAFTSQQTITGGYVGIGTTSPQAALHVKGADGPQFTLQNSSDNTSWYFSDDVNDNLVFQPNTGTGAYISRDGNYHVNSDERLKKDITPIGGVLDRVLQLRPVSYHFRSAPEGTPPTLGLIAQEVEPLFPEVVGERSGMKSMTYTELIPVTIGAIQELNRKLTEELERRDAENAGLKESVSELKELVQAMSEKLNKGTR